MEDAGVFGRVTAGGPGSSEDKEEGRRMTAEERERECVSSKKDEGRREREREKVRRGFFTDRLPER